MTWKLGMISKRIERCCFFKFIGPDSASKPLNILPKFHSMVGNPIQQVQLWNHMDRLSNLFTRWGDLDISIELPNGSFISSAGKKHKQTLLEDVRKALRRRDGEKCHTLQAKTDSCWC